MDMIKTLLEHRSIRKYKSDSVPQEILDDILNAAIRTSTTGNMQVYSIIVTSDAKLKDKLLPLPFGQEMLVKAPLVLTDMIISFHFLRPVSTLSLQPRMLQLRQRPTDWVSAILGQQLIWQKKLLKYCIVLKE